MFPESAIDELKMVTAAQIMSHLSIPPVAFLEVLSERKTKSGAGFLRAAGHYFRDALHHPFVRGAGLQEHG